MIPAYGEGISAVILLELGSLQAFGAGPEEGY